MFSEHAADFSVFGVPFVVPTLKARLQLHEAESRERRDDRGEYQQHRTHI
ncbi:hypothetical protein MPS_5119 [Mycobacterium pseudoshottsii JCM 15466]|nr:hypothetical protein MPS_5119 [Mycobacterium pseudoshottsii JCM 15466]